MPHTVRASARPSMPQRRDPIPPRGCGPARHSARFFRRDRGHASEQGNRVKKSCGDETCEKLVVPCGNFAFEAHAVLAGRLSDQVESDVL